MGSELTILASDLELTIEVKINAEVLIEGVAVVNGRVLADFVKRLNRLLM
jgi:DNA polymerase III sliding clamp (beta) subunit (PCNA family)